MAKRNRGANRPGQRRTGGRTPVRPTPQPERPVSQLAAAADVAEDIADERPATAADELRRAVRASTPPRPATQRQTTPRASSALAERAAAEYVYVAEDVRRILVIGGALMAVMFVLWLLIGVFRVITF